MKKYTSLGGLLVDYRQLNNISQADLASNFDVDIRTIIRWEKNETLLKPEKEEEISLKTFIPYQVIRNLNTTHTIYTYYDFTLRKYSLTPLFQKLPEPRWIKESIDSIHEKVRFIQNEEDIDNIIRFTKLQGDPLKTTSRQLIKESIKSFPELNLIVTDELGNYAGHSLYFSLGLDTYQKIKEQKMMENDLTIHDLVNYKTQKTPVFYCHSITADCNENFFVIIGTVLKFYRDHYFNKDYIYALITSRHDSYAMSKSLGVNLIWEDIEKQQKNNLQAPPRLYEGNFTEFLK